jgi:AcrR family transcriptional regulator
MVRQGLTPARLVVAAAELADESGLPSVTISALARRFAVQPASIYSHVAGLDALLEQTTLLALDELAGLLAEALPGRSGRAALFAFADTHRDYAHAHPGRWQAAQRRVDPDVAAASSGGRISRSARAIMSAYGLTPSDEVHAVRLLGSAINGFVALESGGGFDHSVPPASESWTRVIDAVDTALRNWPTAPAALAATPAVSAAPAATS